MSNSDAILKKIAKKTKIGVYDPREVVDALNQAGPGWTIEPTTTTMQAGSYSNQHDRFETLWLDKLGAPPSASRYGRAVTDVPAGVSPVVIGADYFTVSFKKDAENLNHDKLVKEVIAVVSKPLIVGKALPSSIQVDGLYVAGFKTESRWAGGISYTVTVQKARLGVPGFLIKSPDGKELELPVQPLSGAKPGNPTALSAVSLWTWLYKETDAPAKAAAYLETPETQGRHSAQQRSKDIELAGGAGKVGSCAICQRLQKLERKRTKSGLPTMVHHGYRRPGVGYILGDCFGVGYPPYELSAEACVDAVAMLVKQIASQKEAINSIKSRTELKTWIAYAPQYRSHMVKEFHLVTIHKNGTVKDHGEVMDQDKMNRMKKSPASLMKMSIEEVESHQDEFRGQEGRFVPSILEVEGTPPEVTFTKEQEQDLGEAQMRLRSMQDDKETFERRIKDWTLQPLPGTASASTRIDAVAEKLLSLTTPEKVQAAVEEAADLLAKLI